MDLRHTLSEVIDQVRGMWRYRWLAVAVAWGISVAGWLFVLSMPDVYRASAKVYLETETLMDPMFRGLALQDNIEAQVAAVSRALLTRPNLEAVARKTDLDLRLGSDDTLESLITRLQRKIRIRADTRRNIFEVSYEDVDRSKAREVVAAIVDSFVEDSLQGRGDDAQMTEKAVDGEIANHEQRLLQAESELAEFKKENLGYMPDDRGDYYARLQRSIDAIDETQSGLRLLSQRRDELNRQLTGESPITGTDGRDFTCSRQPQIDVLESELASLQINFTDKHPRIVSLRDTLSVLAQQCGEERSVASSSNQSRRLEALESSPVYQNIRMLLTDTELEITTLRAKLAEEQAEVGRLRANVDKIADVEKNLKRLTRDYDIVQERFQELIRRRETLRSKQRIGPVTDATPLRTIEPPFAPSDPASPNRPLMLLAVLVIALVVGGGVAFCMNHMKPVFYSGRAVKRLVGLPVLGSVSMVSSPETRWARRRGFAAWTSSVVLLVVVSAGVVIFRSEGVLLLQQWLRMAGA